MARLVAFIFTYRGPFVALALLAPAAFAWQPGRFYGVPLGYAALAAGFWLRLAGVRQIGGRARIHSAGANHLITSGIFARVRHPLYLGNTLVIGGLIALFFQTAGALLALIFLLGLYTGVAAHEERSLVRQMGEPYVAYLGHVPRWRIRLTPYRSASGAGPMATPWVQVLRHERIFVAACAVLGLLSIPWRSEALPRIGAADHAAHRFALAAAAVAAGMALFLKIAARLRRKRGSWLSVARISGRQPGMYRPCPGGQS